ncbi:type II CAAX endopeptidase family protein [Phycicoccus ginsengisoli]
MTTEPLRLPDLTAKAPTATPASATGRGAAVVVESAPLTPARTRHLLIATIAMFVLPWVVWGSAIAQGHDLIGWRLPQGIALWVLTPSIALACLVIGGRTALRDLVRRIVRWHGPWWVYVTAVGLPLAVGATTVGITRMLGRPSHLGQTEDLTTCLVYFSYAIGLFLLTEEAGWTGVILPRLQTRMRPLAASLVLGVVWGLWHLPLLNVPGEHDHGLPFAAFLLLIVPTCVVMSAFVNATRGTVLAAALFHAAFNATYTYVGVVGPDHTLIWTAGAVSTVVAAVMVVASRGQLFHTDR